MEQLLGRFRGWVSATKEDAKLTGYATVYLRIALGVDFLSAVADRLGLWGPPGTPMVAWGNFHNFLGYTAKLNPWFPASWIPAVGWAATICEILLGLALVIGYRTRLAALLSGLLALVFALGMVFGVGIHAPLAYSVFAVSAASFLLAQARSDPWSVDRVRQRASAVKLPAARQARETSRRTAA